MKIKFQNKEGKTVLESNDLNKKDITVLDESLEELAQEENVNDQVSDKEEGDDDAE